ncbi:hypothetical protein LCGC14_1177260 [marine sediment metagenome]|uniref:FHA domain-containing protein n=1 Tax=marine sediment metagenome TaxID=412755 RepID=A0A0F9P655_9ZZZZ
MKTPITFTYQLEDHEIVKTFLHDTIKVGSLSSAQLCVAHESVSRMHCYVQGYAAEYYIHDLGSVGGTYLNGQRVNKAKLQTGDVVRLGTVELKVQIGTEQPRADDCLNEPADVPVDNLPNASVLAKLAGLVKDVVDEATQSHVYYCEPCLMLHGKIIEMDQDKCPTCGGSWKLNRGQARHSVSMRLQHYQRLAKLLGIK